MEVFLELLNRLLFADLLPGIDQAIGPLAVLGISAGASLVGGFFKAKGAKKRARKAEEERLRRIAELRARLVALREEAIGEAEEFGKRLVGDVSQLRRGATETATRNAIIRGRAQLGRSANLEQFALPATSAQDRITSDAITRATQIAADVRRQTARQFRGAEVQAAFGEAGRPIAQGPNTFDILGGVFGSLGSLGPSFAGAFGGGGGLGSGEIVDPTLGAPTGGPYFDPGSFGKGGGGTTNLLARRASMTSRRRRPQFT